MSNWSFTGNSSQAGNWASQSFLIFKRRGQGKFKHRWKYITG